MPGDFTDKQLVKKAQQGDKRAFDMLVMRFQSRLLGFVGRYTKDPIAAQDIAQETFLKAYRGVGGFRGESAFYTWLCRIAINVAKNYLATNSRHEFKTEQPLHDEIESHKTVGSILEESATTEGTLYSDELIALIQSVLGEMPSDLRSALTLREMDGLSYEDIASMMSCPIGTVRSRIFRAREILNAAIKEYMEFT